MCRLGLMLFYGMVLFAGRVETQTKAADAPPAKSAESAIDFEKARILFQKRQKGEKLSEADEKYLQRAMEARRNQQGGRPAGNLTPRESTGIKPLTEMSADERYQGEDGGLDGGGQNAPPVSHQHAAEKELAAIQPLDTEGRLAVDGRIVFVSISMSNATQEFSQFKRLADEDPAKSDRLTIVDCAQGGQAMAEWAAPDARPWAVAEERLQQARVSPKQVQVAWIKLANKGPRGDLNEHGKTLQSNTLAVIQNAKARFPNLRIAYLSSRIYGGHAINQLNPEPFAYESAFPVRWLIRDQIAEDKALNFNANNGAVKAPLLLWGPYLWADGTTPRKSDKLTYVRDDFAADGTHPSEMGRDKVARVMLHFFKTDSLAKPWFVQ